MTHPLNTQSVVIGMPQTQQEERSAQQNGIWNRMSTMPTSQKGVLISLGIYSICTAFAAIAEFFEPDPPPDSLLPSFVDSTVVAKNTQKWSFGLISLTTTTAIMLYASYCLQRNQQQAEKMASIIKRSQIEEEMIEANPGPSGLQT